MSDLKDATSVAATARCAGTVEHPVRMQDRAELHEGASLGAFGFLNVGAVVYTDVSIGRYLSCGRGVEIGAIAHPMRYLSTHDFTVHPRWFTGVPGYGLLRGKVPQLSRVRTSIGHDVWIGSRAVILAGVTIGTGAVIGAGAVVTRNVDTYEVVAGVPAKHLRSRFRPEIIEALLRSEWWALPHKKIQTLNFDDVELCLAELGVSVRPSQPFMRCRGVLQTIRDLLSRR